MPFEIRTNHCILITIQTMMLHVDVAWAVVYFFYLNLIVSYQHLKQKQNWLTSALWNYDKTCIKQKQQKAEFHSLTAGGADGRAVIRGEKCRRNFSEVSSLQK